LGDALHFLRRAVAMAFDIGGRLAETALIRALHLSITFALGCADGVASSIGSLMPHAFGLPRRVVYGPDVLALLQGGELIGVGCSLFPSCSSSTV
jgi:hypothetical protein